MVINLEEVNLQRIDLEVVDLEGTDLGVVDLEVVNLECVDLEVVTQEVVDGKRDPPSAETVYITYFTSNSGNVPTWHELGALMKCMRVVVVNLLGGTLGVDATFSDQLVIRGLNE